MIKLFGWLMGNWTILLELADSLDLRTTSSSTLIWWSRTTIGTCQTLIGQQRLSGFRLLRPIKRTKLIRSYTTKLINSNAGAKVDSAAFNLPSQLVTPTTGEGTSRWLTESVSVDDRYMLFTKFRSSLYRPLYILNISGGVPTEPELIKLKSIEKEEEIFYSHLRSQGICRTLT